MDVARLYVLLYSLVLLKKIGVLVPSTYAVAVECTDCFYWQYCRQEDKICVDCERCGNGLGATTLCDQFNNTVCEPCPDGTYSALSVKDNAYLCYSCTKCKPDRDTIAKCNSEADTTCGPCPTGMFAYDNGTCLECSPCPDDETATRYIECSVNGAPRNYLCVPGACPECGEHNITIDTSDGGWITRQTTEVLFDDATEPTTEDTTVVTAVAIIVAVAVGLLVVFVSIFATWLLRGMYCSSLLRRQRRNNDEAALNLIQNSVTEEASEEDTSSSTMVSITSARVKYVRRVVPSVELLDIIGVNKEVEDKWSLVAEALGVGKDVITEIDHACNSDMAESCRLMLDKWSKGADLSSWKNLIKACNRNFLHSIAKKLEIFFADEEAFCESDVVLWDYFVEQIKRESQKQFIIPRWHTPFDETMVQLDVRVQGQVCSLEDAIALLQSEESPKPVVLLGEAGTGKTTMIKQLVEKWCRVGSNSQFALVIYVNMATDAGMVIDLPSLINLHLERTADNDMVTGMCEILEKQRGKGMLIILDGYDEIQDNTSDISCFLERLSALPKASFLLACQPSYVTSTDYRVTTIEVSLLRNDQVEDYVQRTVGRRGIAMIRSSPLWPMMHYPLLLSIICHLIYYQMDVTRLSTLTQLYHHLIIKLISDQVKGISYSGKDYSATVRAVLGSCAKASYEAMLHHQCSLNGILDVNRIVESGLIVKRQNTFYFTHHTFLEFFTAYYVAYSSDIDSRTLKVNPSDSLLLPFISGLTGRIAYIAEEMDNNSLVATSVCYSEAKSPVTGHKHSTTDTLGTLALNSHVLTHRQYLSLKIFMQEHKAPKQLDISGLNSNTLPLHSNTQIALTDKSSATDNVKLRELPHVINDIREILNCEHLTHLIATDITITKEEWLLLVHVLETNNSLVSLNLSHNVSISDNSIVAGLTFSLTANNSLQILMLSYCNLTSTYANKLMTSLLCNSCLLQIDLSNNMIEQLNIQIVVKVLKREIIQEINVSSNPIIENVRSQLKGITYGDQKIIYSN